ncbi:MAG: efflux RND transporter periplasmic adaptor subunit [Magnetococcales bacterium]|nr:efflux RND transporter periplasmic adaptor subunit [Magnetococcales bacterium]
MTPAAWPALRLDLELIPGTPDHAGAPTWILVDPLRNRHFHLGRVAMEILRLWDLGHPEAIAAQIARTSALRPVAADFVNLLKFLVTNELIVRATPDPPPHLSARWRQRQRPGYWLTWLLHHYLFFRIPLVSPERFLTWLAPWVTSWFHSAIPLLIALVWLTGGGLVARQWEMFLATFPYFSFGEGMAGLAVALLLLKSAHELGHACAAHRHGVTVPTMGVAFLVMWPMMYTDVTQTWRLTERRKRLVIGCAGMVVELAIGGIALLAWSFLSPGPARGLAFFLATAAMLGTLTINISPFMRFDGYYLLSDWLGIPNLHERAFALGRWRLREMLFGIGAPPPEAMRPRLRNGLILLAWTTWLYRFLLFIGIAVLVYHFFFKILGVLLFAVEIGWFVARPLLHELRAWRGLPIRFNAALSRTLLVVLAGLAWMIVPWEDEITLPALHRSHRQWEVHAPVAARVVKVETRTGAAVEAGAPLLQLASPAWDQEEHELQLAVTIASIRLEQGELGGKGGREQVAVLRQTHKSALTALESHRQRQQLLTLTAPWPGIVAEWDDTLEPGRRVTPHLTLGRLRSRASEVVGVVGQEHRHRLEPGRAGRFLPDDPTRPGFGVHLAGVMTWDQKQLFLPYFAMENGGPIAVRAGTRGEILPEQPVWPITLTVDDDLPAPGQVTTGVAVVQAPPTSRLLRWARQAWVLLLRESGF